MKTHTVLVEPHQKIIEVCNEYETNGWAVRQIVPNPAYGHAYVVFEAPGTEDALVPAVLPLRTFTGTEVGSRTTALVGQNG